MNGPVSLLSLVLALQATALSSDAKTTVPFLVSSEHKGFGRVEASSTGLVHTVSLCRGDLCALQVHMSEAGDGKLMVSLEHGSSKVLLSASFDDLLYETVLDYNAAANDNECGQFSLLSRVFSGIPFRSVQYFLLQFSPCSHGQNITGIQLTLSLDFH